MPPTSGLGLVTSLYAQACLSLLGASLAIQRSSRNSKSQQEEGQNRDKYLLICVVETLKYPNEIMEDRRRQK